MIEKVSLRMFWTAMLLCASTALIAIWNEGFEHTPFMKLVPTFFVIGFASFLVWAPLMVYRFLAK